MPSFGVRKQSAAQVAHAARLADVQQRVTDLPSCSPDGTVLRPADRALLADAYGLLFTWVYAIDCGLPEDARAVSAADHHASLLAALLDGIDYAKWERFTSVSRWDGRRLVSYTVEGRVALGQFGVSLMRGSVMQSDRPDKERFLRALTVPSKMCAHTLRTMGADRTFNDPRVIDLLERDYQGCTSMQSRLA